MISPPRKITPFSYIIVIGVFLKMLREKEMAVDNYRILLSK